jgi:hypothetical protein
MKAVVGGGSAANNKIGMAVAAPASSIASEANNVKLRSRRRRRSQDRLRGLGFAIGRAAYHRVPRSSGSESSFPSPRRIEFRHAMRSSGTSVTF